MATTIRTNNVPRDYSLGMEFNGKERQKMLEEFDYFTEEDFNTSRFINYKGFWYSLGDFMLINEEDGEFIEWQGKHSDSISTGVVVRYVENADQYVMGTYCS